MAAYTGHHEGGRYDRYTAAAWRGGLDGHCRRFIAPIFWAHDKTLGTPQEASL